MFKKLKLKWLESNIWKFFIHSLTNRRNFIPLLSVYFLTLPNTTAQQIWLFIWAGFLVMFFLEIPSGYFSDRFWHKNTLILAKILMVLSTSCFVWGDGILYFALWSIFLNSSFAFSSWTQQALLHETLTELKRWKDYTKISSKISGWVSLISAFLIISLPFFTAIDIRLPFEIWLWFDIVWFLVVLTIVSPIIHEHIKVKKSIVTILREVKWTNFYVVAGFTALISWILMWWVSFREVYLQSIGFPIIFIGFVMWFSRVVWFLVSQVAHKIEKIFTIKQMFFIEIFVFSVGLILFSIFKNPYIAGLTISLLIWYRSGRASIIDNYLMNSLPDKRYKATMLSVKWQMSSLIQVVVVFAIWFVMSYSYRVGFFSLWILLFVGLSISYLFVRKIK